MPNAIKIVAPTIVLLVLLTPIWLHYSQKSHNELPFVLEQEFPESQPFVNGEIYAATMRAIIKHELDGFLALDAATRRNLDVTRLRR